MTTGYEARPAGRRTFADEGLAPVQTTSGATGQSQRASVVGGESIGGVEGGNYTQPGNVAQGLGAYFEQFMEPVVQRKQQAQFFKGYTEAQSGRALQELTDNDSPLTKIFGPSGFAQGAQFYAGQAAINRWTTAQLADQDNLKRMSPEEMSKHMAASMQEMMTGDPYADQQIQAGLLEAQGSVIQTVTKARYKWQQDTMVEQQSEATNTAADALQQVASTNFALGEKADAEAIRVQAQRFLGGLQKPDGMTDENYQKFLYNFMRRSMADGNFYGVELLRARGIDSVLTEDQQRQVTDAYERYSNRALDEAAASPDIVEMALKLEHRKSQVELQGGDAGSMSEFIEGFREINTILRQRTGVERDYVDAKEIIQQGKSWIGNIAARAKHLRSREEAAADRAADRADRLAERQAEADAKTATIRAAWATGQVTEAEALGLASSDFNTVAMEDFSKGDYTGIARAYIQGGYKSEGVSKKLQAMTAAGIGDTYTKATESAYNVWKQFNAANPELAHTYFGDQYHFAFSTFDRMLSSAGPEVAYRDAFALAGKYNINNIPPSRRKEAEQELRAAVDANDFGYLNPTRWGNDTLTATSKAEFLKAITDEYVRISEFSPRSVPEMVSQAANQALNSGRLEKYGKYAWMNTRGGSPTIGRLLHLQGVDSKELVQAVINERIASVGGDEDTVRVIRTGNNLTLQYLKGGVTGHIVVPFPHLQAAAQKYVEKRRASSTAQPREATHRPSHYVPGKL